MIGPPYSVISAIERPIQLQIDACRSQYADRQSASPMRIAASTLDSVDPSARPAKAAASGPTRSAGI